MVALDPQKTALIAIDPQVWTMGLPLAPHGSQAVATAIARLCGALKARGGFSIASRAAFSEGYADMLRQEVDVPLSVPQGGIPPSALSFVGEVVDCFDLALTKRQWSAFYGTELDLQLRRRRIDTLVITGVMTNFGVESTARDAWQHNYRVVIAQDACSSLDESMHKFSVEKILPRVARVVSTDAVVGALAS